VVGTLLGLGLLTKAYFLTTALAVIAWFAFEAWRRRSRAAARRLLLVVFAAAAIAGWWYWATWRATGSLSGEMHDVAFHRLGFGECLRAAWRVNWMRVLDASFCSHIWAGTWSYLSVRSWMYHAFALLAVAGAAGTVWVAVRDGEAGGRESGSGSHDDFHPRGVRAGRAYVFLLLSLAFLALDVFAMHIYLLPYYAGFIAHTQGNRLPALELRQLASGGWTLCERLAVNKPAWLSARGMLALRAGYVTGSCGTAAVAWRMARRIRCDSPIR
jgi:hypothetical protein